MILDNRFPPDERVEKEAVILVKAGFEVHLLCLTFEPSLVEENYRGIRVHRVAMPRWLYKKLSALILTAPFYRWFWYWQIKSFVKKFQIDVLHFHDLPLTGVGLRIRAQIGTPIVVDLHENYPALVEQERWANTFWGRLLINKKKWYWVERVWLTAADAIICVAEEMRQRVREIIQSAVPLYVVPNTVDVQAFLASQEPNPALVQKFAGKFGVLYYGGFDQTRGLEALLQAAAVLRTEIPELQIILVGTGTIEPSLKQLCLELGIEKYVAFEGWQSQRHLNAYMHNAAVTVIPHIKSVQTDNSSPNKLFIFMLYGKAVVVSNCNSLVNVVQSHDCGLIFPSGDSQALANRILYLYQNASERERLGTNGKLAVQRHYDWQITSKDLVVLYQQLAKNQRRV